ncbi:MAG: aminotransferase class III-fold pyridoxal phosphate-dependent enzyme [Clostridia bacterium]
MKLNTYTKCDEMLARASKVIPCGVYGHLGPAEGCMIPASAYPKFCSKAKGSYFWDLDGNKFIDYMCAYGPNVLGYCDPDVDAAALAQAKIGNCTTTPSSKLVEFAELLVNTVNCADWAFFAKNGGDVTTLAMMTARAATGRSKVIMVNNYYHGVAPFFQKADCDGAVEEDVANNLMVDWNNFEQLEALVNKNKGEIAAFISTPYMHGNFIENILPAEGYWQKVRKLCTDNGIVLIIDDVRCGFRLNLKGSDFHYGFEADLICFCKALANGWNVSALCGKDSLKGAVSGIAYTGSYWQSAVPFAAGIACVTKMRDMKADVLMREKGIKISEGLRKVGENNGVNLIVSGEPTLFYTRIADDPTLMVHQEWIANVVQRGVFMTNHHNHFINCSLTDEDINQTLEICDEAMKVVKNNHPEINWAK